MTEILAAWVGPPADFIKPPESVTEQGEPVFLVGLHEAVQSANWRPLAEVANVEQIERELPGGTIPDPAEVEAAEQAAVAEQAEAERQATEQAAAEAETARLATEAASASGRRGGRTPSDTTGADA